MVVKESFIDHVLQTGMFAEQERRFRKLVARVTVHNQVGCVTKKRSRSLKSMCWMDFRKVVDNSKLLLLKKLWTKIIQCRK